MRTFIPSLLILAGALAVPGAPRAQATVPGSMEITCNVDRKVFRRLARNETQATFNLWDAATSDNLCDSRLVQMKDLVVIKSKTERFDSQRKPRRFDSIRAVIGTDASPVQLCSGPETWLDVTVGSTTLTCDFSADDDANKPPPPPARKRILSVASAQRAQPLDISARVFNSTDIPIPSGVTTVLNFDSERWDTDGIHSTGGSRLTAPTTGKYFIYGHIRWQVSEAGASRILDVRVNGSGGNVIVSAATAPIASPANLDQNVATHFELQAGEFVELFAHQDSGGTLNIPHFGQKNSPEFGMVKVP